MILKTLDDTDIGADRLTVQPGGYSGWHAHQAAVFITVTQGSIVWYDGSDPLCTAHTYSAGQSFIGSAYRIHDVRNASNSTAAEFVAIHINPEGLNGPPSGSTGQNRITATLARLQPPPWVRPSFPSGKNAGTFRPNFCLSRHSRGRTLTNKDLGPRLRGDDEMGMCG
jgi:quercetin dioxygenase-like cupin family protein